MQDYGPFDKKHDLKIKLIGFYHMLHRLLYIFVGIMQRTYDFESTYEEKIVFSYLFYVSKKNLCFTSVLFDIPLTIALRKIWL